MSRKQAYSDARVAELLSAYHRTGEGRIRDEIVEHMRPLVHAVARKFAGREPQEDLESEGFVGLIRAVDRFTPDRGARFSTFAQHLVAGQIRHYLRDRGHLIRQPAWVQELNQRVQRAESELEQKLQRAPTVAEIASATNLDEEAVEELMVARQAARIVRLEGPSDAEETDYFEVDPEKLRSRDYVTFELPVEDKIVLEGALVRLKELEKNVLHYFFYQDFSQSEIARKMGISCNYVGYVLRNGLKHMRERLPQERAEVQRMVSPGDAESVVDPATGIYTGDYFYRRLAEEVSRAQHYEKAVSVCTVQISGDCSADAFFNAVEFLKSRLRKVDVLGRLGSREFGLIFPGTGVVAADQVARRLAQALQLSIGGTVHVGTAAYPDDGRSAQQLTAAARAQATPLDSSSAPVAGKVPAAVA